MRLTAFYTLNFPTYFAVYFSTFFNILLVKYIFTKFTRNILILIPLNVIPNFNITYLLEFVLGQQSFYIVHVDRYLTIVIWAKKLFSMGTVSKSPHVISKAQPAKRAFAI